MTTDLPDLDEAISFAVDDGAQAGPFTMNQIIDSVRSGERAPNTLVWWAGQPDWVAFDAVPDLLAQVEVSEESAAPEEPPPPEEEMAEAPEDSAEGDGLDEAAAVATVASMAPNGDLADPFADVEEYVFSDQSDEGIGPAATITESFGAETAGDLADASLDSDALTGEALADTELINADLVGDVGAEAEGWGVAAEEHIDVVEDIADIGDVEDIAEFGDVEEIADTVASADVDVEEGSFGAPVGELADEFGGSGLFGDGPTEAVRDETSSSLQSVSERIEALGSEAPAAALGGLFGSTRRAISEDDAPAEASADAAVETDPVVEDMEQLVDAAETDRADASEVSFPEPESAEPTFEEPDFEAHEAFVADSTGTSEDDGFDELDQIVDEIDSADDDASDDVTLDDSTDESDEQGPQDEAIDEGVSNAELEALFAEMVETSGGRHQRFDWASKLDDVSVGAIIASTLGKGFSLVDLHSLGQSHQVRFEHPESGERLIVELDSLGPAAADGELLNQHAFVTVGLGQRVSGDQIVGDDFAPDSPGTITIEMDMESGYAFSTVDLIWEFNELLGEDRSIDAVAVNQRVDAAVHALRGYWHDRFGS